MNLRAAGGAHLYLGARVGRGMRLQTKIVRGRPLPVDLERLAALLIRTKRADERPVVGPFNPRRTSTRRHPRSC